ncbi:MAG: signal peptidase I [Candidatus Jordarchaeales archaeon]
MSEKKGEVELARYVLLIVLIVIMVFGGFQLLKAYLGTPAPLRVVSTSPSSMEPTLYYGDLVVIKKAPFYEIGVGDVIVFDAYNWYFEAGELPPNIPVIHRVYWVSFENGQLYYYTWGDNRLTNPSPDPAPTPYWLVHGKVVFTIPKLGLVILFIQSGGFIVLIVILIILLMITITAKDVEEESKRDGKRHDEGSKII